MKGSFNDAVSACVPCGVRSFRTRENDVGPSRVFSHRDALSTNG
jgi:hypothetical protein